MATMRGTYWYEDLPAPYDPDCRGKFCILEANYSLEIRRDYDQLAERKEFFVRIKQFLEEEGKVEWLADNGIGLNSVRVTGVIDQPAWVLRVKVLVDLPNELRTMYALRFS